MKSLLTLWNFLNGKKTTIGALLLLLAQVLRMTGRGEWAGIIEQLQQILVAGGIGLTTIGLTHKAKKQIKQPKTAQ